MAQLRTALGELVLMLTASRSFCREIETSLQCISEQHISWVLNPSEPGKTSGEIFMDNNWRLSEKRESFTFPPKNTLLSSQICVLKMWTNMLMRFNIKMYWEVWWNSLSSCCFSESVGDILGALARTRMYPGALNAGNQEKHVLARSET